MGGIVMDERFGEFIRAKRMEKGITLRHMATLLGIAPAYMSDIEKGRRYPPDKEKLFKLSNILGLDMSDKDRMFDLAASEKSDAVSQDISSYIMDDEIVRVALRTARRNNATKAQWQKAIDIFNGKK